jgi:hypothetical protein
MSPSVLVLSTVAVVDADVAPVVRRAPVVEAVAAVVTAVV